MKPSKLHPPVTGKSPAQRATYTVCLCHDCIGIYYIVDDIIMHNDVLTHLPLDIMAAAFADAIFKCIFVDEMFCVSIQISLRFVSMGPIDRRQAIT